jgi:hypothetical protein
MWRNGENVMKVYISKAKCAMVTETMILVNVSREHKK